MKRPKRFLFQKIDLDTGVIVQETYSHSKRRHRKPEEGPAVIHRHSQTGRVIYEEYDTDGEFHRMDGPATIQRDARTGIVTEEQYYIYGERHRTDGPAVIQRDRVTGTLRHISYWEDGQRHRDSREGPAEIYWHRDFVSEYYWKYGRRFDTPTRPEENRGPNPPRKPPGSTPE